MTIITETEITRTKYTLALANNNVDSQIRKEVASITTTSVDYMDLLSIFLEDARRRETEGEPRSDILRKLEEEYALLELENQPTFNDVQPLVLFAASYHSFKNGDSSRRLSMVKALADSAGFIPLPELRNGLWLYILRAIVWSGIVTSDRVFAAQAINAVENISDDETALLPECLTRWLREGDAL